jgi:hypothetical protein
MYDDCFGRAANDAPVSFDRFSRCVEGLPKRSLLLPTLVHMQVWQDSRSISESRKRTIKVPVSLNSCKEKLENSPTFRLLWQIAPLMLESIVAIGKVTEAIAYPRIKTMNRKS